MAEFVFAAKTDDIPAGRGKTISLDAGLDVAGLWENTFFSRSLTGALFGGACGLLVSFAIQLSRLSGSSVRLRSSANQTMHPSK